MPQCKSRVKNALPRVLLAAGEDTVRMIGPAIEAHARLLLAPRMEEALRLARTEIDAVVCDACFEECRMFALLQAVKENRRRRRPPVICCPHGAPSPSAREAIEAAARSLGAVTIVDLARLTQRYEGSVAAEILAQIIKRRITRRKSEVTQRR